MRRGRLPLTAVALAIACAACGSRSLVVTGGTLLDGTGGPPVPDAVVIVERGRIACAGTAASCPIGGRARELDGTGTWITPGLFDTHTHPRHRQRPGRTLRDDRLRFLMGVTSARDAGTYGDVIRNLAEMPRTRDPHRPVPRLVVSGRLGLQVHDADGAARSVAGLRAGGGTAVNVKDELSEAVLRSLVRAAHSSGLPVYGHAWRERPTRSAVLESVDAGLDGLSHLLGIAPLALSTGYLADPPAPPGERAWSVWRRSLWVDADADSLARVAGWLAGRGVWLEPSLLAEALWADAYRLPVGLHRLLELPFVVERLRKPNSIPDLTEDERVRLRLSLAGIRRFVHGFHAAGGVLVTGSAEALVPGLAIHEEMRQLVLAGLTPADALGAATREAARVVGVSDSLGTLEPGKIADFLLLEGDPWADIANTQLVHTVVKGGVAYNPASLFDDLADDMGDRTTGSLPRLLAGALALLLAVGLAILAIRRHRASLPKSWRA